MLLRRQLMLASGLLAMPAIARAQGAFPNRPLRLVVPFAAGGGTDVLARILANGMTERLGQQIVVENRTGAGGNIAMEYVVRAPADGYTLLMGTNGAVAVNRHLYKNLSFDPLKDLDPVSLAFRITHLLAVNANLPVKNVQELIALAKAKPGELTFGSGGTGSMIHLAGELFKLRTGIDIVHVPYRGGGPAMNDLAAGTISMMFDSVPSAEPQIRGGRVKALAVCGQVRHPLLPEVPTMAEAGVANYDASSTGGIFAPKGTPPEIVARLNKAVADCVNDAGFKQQLFKAGGDAEASTPEGLMKMSVAESAVWEQVVAEAKITAN
ncbi:tripartite tricarboxylate transporter substrate binding protein [Acetobacteraceae bacterium H6797]|nr:tripartite tricarboxylate transporter substrate binding protein [Acetobacteraceae bacterium H6797]